MEAILFGKGKQKLLLRDLKQSLLFANGSKFLHLGNDSNIYVWGMKASAVFRKRNENSYRGMKAEYSFGQGK